MSNLKYIMAVAVVLASVMTLAFAPSADGAEITGSCGADGDNLSYTITALDDGTDNYKLTISGTGAMADYTTAAGGSPAPWYDMRSSIIQLELGDGITRIGDNAFLQLAVTTDNPFTIPSTVTSIGDNAFWNFGSKTTIPAGVKELGDTAFYGDFDVLVDTGNPSYRVSDGIILTYDWSTIVQAPFGVTNEEAEKVMGMDGVTAIGDYAFHNCSGLGGITIPGNIETIGQAAFESSGVGSVTFSEGLVTIGNAAFNNCSQLSGGTDGVLTIPDSVTTVDKRAFACSNEYESKVTGLVIGDGVTTIGDYAFSALKNVTSLYVGQSVQSIGDYAFWGMSKVTGDLSLPSVTSIGDYAFMGCTGFDGTLTIGYAGKTLNLVFSSEDKSGFNAIVITQGESVVDNFAYNWTEIQSIGLPDTLTSIGAHAFANSSITKLELPSSVSSIGEGAFYGCDELTSVDLSGVTTLGSSAFYGCDGMTSVILAGDLSSVPDYAFSDCTSLTYVSAVGSPDDVCVIPGTSIGENAFRYCDLQSVVYLTDRMTSVGEDAFAGCSNLIAAYIPSSVISVGNGALTSMDGDSGNQGSAVIYCGDETVAGLMKDDRDGGGSGNGNFLNYTTAIADLNGGILQPDDFIGYAKGSLLYSAQKEGSTLTGWVLGEGTDVVNEVSAPSTVLDSNGNEVTNYFRYKEVYNTVWEETSELGTATLSGITQTSEELEITGGGLLPLEGVPALSVDGAEATLTSFTVTIEGGTFTSSMTFSSPVDLNSVDMDKPAAPGEYTVTLEATGTSSGVSCIAEGTWTFTILTPSFIHDALSVSEGSGVFVNPLVNVADGAAVTYAVDPAVATVGADGGVTVTQPGTATVTAAVGGYQFTYSLTVLSQEEAVVSSGDAVLSVTEPSETDKTTWREAALAVVDSEDREEAVGNMVFLDILSLETGDGVPTSFSVSYAVFGFADGFDPKGYEFHAVHIVNGSGVQCEVVATDVITVTTSGFSPFVLYYLEAESETTDPVVDPSGPSGPQPDEPDDTPSVNPDEDLPLPPLIVQEPEASGDNTVEIVACAAAAVVAALIAAFLIMEYRRN